MPEKDGAEEKSTKSVVNKKQKQMMGEEGYDIARDMGRVPKTRDKKDATTMPPSKEMEKTRKVYKGPSALELVKKKYKGQIMDVGKKKANEELDLTQVAEAFGGYIVETKSNGKNKKDAEPELKGIEKIPVTKKEPVRVSDPNFQRLLDTVYGTKTSSQIDAEILKRRTPTDIAARSLAQKRKTDLPLVQKILQKTAKKAGVPDVFTNKTDTTVNPKEMQVDDEGNIIANPPPQTPEQKKRFKQSKEYQDDKKRGEKPLIDQDKFSSDTRTVDQDRVTRGSGDGRKAGRRGKTVTYSTFTKKPKVTGGEDRATDTAFQPFRPKPEEIEKIKPKPETKPETKRQRNKRVRTAADQIISDIRTGKDKTVKTKTEVPPPPPPKPPKPPTTGGFGKRFGDFRKFTRRNPALSLIGFDAIKSAADTAGNILSPANLGLRGGKVGRRSARQ